MKIFVSHQRADTALAAAVAARLRSPHGIDSYLDVIDPDAGLTGDKLGDYLRAQLATCQQLMAVVSEATKGSWWVPWEIGIATEKDYPIATYAGDNTALPSYLKKWPYLRTMADLDKYAAVSTSSERSFVLRKSQLSEATARSRTTAEFYTEMRRALGQ